MIGKVVQAPVMSSNEEDELFYIYTIRGNNFPYLISLDVCGEATDLIREQQG